MSMESGDEGPNFGSQDPSHTTENQRPVNQFQAYYPTQTSQPTFSEKLSGISEHPLSKQVTDLSYLKCPGANSIIGLSYP